MIILVTGISGRIGSILAKSLSEAGHDIRGLVWPGDPGVERLQGLAYGIVEGSLVNRSDVDRAVAGVDCIYHLGAAFQAGGPFTEEDYFEINVQGTFNMLEAARNLAPKLQHFFFASTDAIYEKYVPGGMAQPIREDEMKVAPAGSYAVSKLLGEDLCFGHYRTHGLPVTVFRFALTVSGAELLHFPQFYLSHWQRTFENRSAEALERFREQLSVDPDEGDFLLIARDEQGRSYMKHIADGSDIAHGLVSGLGKAGIAGEVYQLAGPRPFLWETAIPYLAEKMNMNYVDIRIPDEVPTYYEFDLSKTRTHLDFQPKLDIFAMIDGAVAAREALTS